MLISMHGIMYIRTNEESAMHNVQILMKHPNKAVIYLTLLKAVTGLYIGYYIISNSALTNY